MTLNFRPLALAAALAVTNAGGAIALTLQPTVVFSFVAQPNTTSINTFDSFMVIIDPSGTWTEDFVNDTGETITDFHFEWDPPSTLVPMTDGGPFFEETGATTSSADFACTTKVLPNEKCAKPGILDEEGFIISVLGFDPGTKFTITPTNDFDCCQPIPLPASLPLAGAGLALLAILRRRRTRV